jgi:class 3 adenylate cyclase
MLDRLYTKFDALANLFSVYPLETIGDCYIACTNLITQQPDDHADLMAQFSLEVINAAKTTLIDEENPDLGVVKIRVGFHSGPLVADVVGTRNPKFCILGDTVNTASRMESTSAVGRVQCSDRSAELIQQQNPSILLKSRGAVPVKGKGEMFTYWVLEESLTTVDEGNTEDHQDE